MVVSKLGGLGEQRVYSSHMKAIRLETQGQEMFHFKSEGRKKNSVPVQRRSDRRSALLLGEGQPFVLFREGQH